MAGVELAREINRHLPPREGLTVLAGITSIVEIRDPQLLITSTAAATSCTPPTRSAGRGLARPHGSTRTFFTKLDRAIRRDARTLVVMLSGLSKENLAELNHRYGLIHIKALRGFRQSDVAGRLALSYA